MHEYRSAGINRHFTEKHGTHLLTREDVEWADLVIGAEGIHTDKASEIATPSSTRTFMPLNLGDFKEDAMDMYVSVSDLKLRTAFMDLFPEEKISKEGLRSFFMRDFAESIQNAAKLTPEQERVINEMKKTPLELVSSPATTTPHRCPVCYGKGVVPNGFYFSVSEQYNTSDAAPQPCRSCDGGGIVWEPSPTPPSSPVFGGPWECPKCGKTHRTSSIHCDPEIQVPESLKK